MLFVPIPLHPGLCRDRGSFTCQPVCVCYQKRQERAKGRTSIYKTMECLNDTSLNTYNKTDSRQSLHNPLAISSSYKVTSVEHVVDKMSWNSRDWIVGKECTPHVSILVSKFNVKHLVVRKVLKNQDYSQDTRPIEIQLLDSLPTNNRIISPRLILQSTPEPNCTTAIFDHYPLGDLYAWRKEFFTEKRNKPVPEPYIWRMFVQMAQAVAFIHNEMGPAQSTRPVIIHRDIKAMNILVVGK